MSFKGFCIFSSDGHFVQRSGIILVILVKELQGNICVKLFWNWSSSLGGDVLWMNCWRHTKDDGRLTTDAGHRVITIAHLEHLVLRWAKKNFFIGRVGRLVGGGAAGISEFFYESKVKIKKNIFFLLAGRGWRVQGEGGSWGVGARVSEFCLQKIQI